MDRILDWVITTTLFLAMGSCSLAIVGSAAHCIYTGDKAACPGIYKGDKCISATLGCP